MMQLTPYTDRWWDAIAHLPVHPAQQPYIGDVVSMLPALGGSMTGHVMADGDTAVGFFRIDQRFSDEYDFAPPGCLGLRSFFVGKDFQGQQFAKQALLSLPAYLASQGLTAPALYLTVNCLNVPAKTLYQRCGFVMSDALYLGGDYGPQHIMYQPLP